MSKYYFDHAYPDHAGHGVCYSESHDAFYCGGCLIWLEPKCPDWKCEFCASRPKETPRIMRGDKKVKKVRKSKEKGNT